MVFYASSQCSDSISGSNTSLRMVSTKRHLSRETIEDFPAGKEMGSKCKVQTENLDVLPSQQLQNINHSMTKNIRAILRRTSAFVYSSKEPFLAGHVGPMTYAHSCRDVIEYFISKESVSKSLSTSYVTMKRGLWMQRINRRKQVMYIFKLENNEVISWKDGSKSLELDSIKDIRTGDMASNYREEYGVSDKISNLWVTIIYTVSNKLKALHVVAKDEHDFDIFFNCICGMVNSRRKLMESISVPDNEKFANIHWHTTVSGRKEDETKDTLTFEDVRKLCDKFHIYCSSKHLLRFFVIADVNHNGLLNFQEFQTFVKLLKERSEVKSIWESLTHDTKAMEFAEFYHFIHDIQKEDLTKEDAHTLFCKFSNPRDELLYEEDFMKFLGAQSYVKDITEDYTRPLNHYFIASSHNTYLLGKQVGETPSVEGYVQVLQQGCRCIEIDIWDDDMGPVVCHGFLTAAIPLVNVVEIIKKYAFITSPYPLFISLEINCSKENQMIASSIFQNSFGSALYRGSGDENLLPSPMELKHKIILKGKKSKGPSLTRTRSGSTIIQNSPSSSYSSSCDSEQEASTKLKEGKKTSSTDPTGIRRIRRLKIKKRVEVIDSILSICGLYGLKFRNFSLPESKTSTHCFSLNEKKVDSMCKEKAQELSIDKHNRRHLMRVYPHALRYKSSNFNPIQFWKLGAQMVATNWQTNDIGQQINLAMFQLSNQKNEVLHSGYVLKPPNLLPNVSKGQDIPTLYEKLHNDPINIKLKILSAQLLPKPTETKNSKESTFAPYVVIEFISDEEPLKSITVKNGTKISNTAASTDYCKENGFNPIWETDVGSTLTSNDFAFVKFTVKTDEISLATSCLKLEHMKEGYRHIPLYNMEGELYIFSTLFICTHFS